MKLYPQLGCISNFTLTQTFVVYFGVAAQHGRKKQNKRQTVICPAMVLQIRIVARMHGVHFT